MYIAYYNGVHAVQALPFKYMYCCTLEYNSRINGTGVHSTSVLSTPVYVYVQYKMSDAVW